MTALAVVGVIVGYLTVGMIIARILHRTDYLPSAEYDDGGKFLLVMVVFSWLVLAPFAIIGAISYGLYRMVTLPTATERRRIRDNNQRREAEQRRWEDIMQQQRIHNLEAELGIKQEPPANP